MKVEFEHPAFSVLQCERWDDALGLLHTASDKLLGEARSQALLDAFGDRRELQAEIHRAVDHLYSIGSLSAGRHALAWALLTCNPKVPSTFHRVLPQLQFALDQAELPEDVDADVRDRLRIWWRVGEGEFPRASRSAFSIAAAILRGEELEDPVVVRPTVEQVASWFRKPYDGPSKVVMPAAKAAKLVSNTKQFAEILDKPLPLVVGRNLADAQRRLGHEFPHCSAALSALFKDLREGEPVKVRPTILLGPPGVSKSRLVRKFAAAVGLQHVQRVDAASSGDNHFGGTSRSWSTSEPSVPARAVLASRTANPLVLIEEIDKARSGHGSINGSLFNALALYLETETAARVRDPSLDAELDLSMVSFICTANEAGLPDFLRDRFRIVQVPKPRLVDLPLLAASIMEDMAREDAERIGDDPLAPDELQVIAKMWQAAGFSLRKLQKIVRATLEARDACSMRH
jgi:ATP-dependent Lon protease